MSMLYLRRIMANPNRGDTTQLTGEEKKKTFISLQGGKTFGRGEGNEVMLLLADSAARSSEYISRHHAKIFHSIDGEIETYVIQDISANGTYINDWRLNKLEKKEIRRGDTIKFGHRNGSQIKPGERASHTDAEFAFSVEGPPDEETSRLLEQKKTIKIKVFSNSPITKEVVTRVQQEEADSTNGNAEEMMNASSSKRGSASNSECNHQCPSTSQLSEVPPRDLKSCKFSDQTYRTTALFIHSCCGSNAFQDGFAELGYRFLAIFPTIPLPSLHTLVGMCILSQASTKKEYEEIITKVLDILKDKDDLSTSVMYADRDRLIDKLIDEEKELKKLCNIMSGDVSNQSSHQNNTISEFKISASTAFYPIPTLYPIIHHEDHRKADLGLSQMSSGFHYIPAYSRQLQKSLEKEEKLPVAIEVPVISSFPSNVRMQSHGEVASSTSGGADEERHSSSYTSATNSRRRTESEDSEILDVVGGVSEFVLEKPVPVAPIVEKLEIIPPADLSLNNGGTQTPSPVLQDREEVNKKEDVKTKKQIEAAAKALRETNTPQSDEQAGPSSISTAPTPVQSPPQILTPADSVASSLNAETTSEENSYDQKEEETPEKINENSKGDVKEEEEAKLPTDGKSKLVQKVNQIAEEAVENVRKEVEEVVTPAPEVSKNTDRRTKMKQLDDISNDSDSDEEQQKATKKRVVRRSTRTARASSPKKVLKEAEEEEMEAGEDDDEEPETSKTPGKGRKSRGAKGVKRTAKGPGRGRKAKSPVAEEEGEGSTRKRGRKKKGQEEKEQVEEAEEVTEPEKKKKKKSVRGAKDQTEMDEKDPKNQCGVGARFCFCADVQFKTNLHWVMCNTCGQWFHVFCIRLSYHGFTDDLFSCCTETDEQTANAINGFHWASQVESGQVFDRVKAEEIWSADLKKETESGKKPRVKGKN